jgi:hypothetical protein
MEKQEIEQVMEMLKTMIAKMDAHQARMEAEDKAWREEIQAETEAIRARRKAVREERMKTNMDACMEPNPGEKEAAAERQETPNEEVAIHPLRACQNETVACQETVEARLEEEKPASVEMKPEVAHQEVPREHTAVKAED